MFDFGRNWQEFSRVHVNSERVAMAAQSLRRLLGRETLKGLSFLDVGCGSGLFSVAARSLGAGDIVGIDINPRSIQSSRQNLQLLAPGSHIEFLEMSVLDERAMGELGTFDIVYAWGSLHHTGAMWQAIRNTARCVSMDGTFVVALYNRHWSSPIWKQIKHIYSGLPRRGQELVAVPFGGVICAAKYMVTGRSPLEKERGMDFWFDVIDWLGGFPYEYTSLIQTEMFLQSLGFVVEKTILAQVPTGCNEFVCIRTRPPFQ